MDNDDSHSIDRVQKNFALALHLLASSLMCVVLDLGRIQMHSNAHA